MRVPNGLKFEVMGTGLPRKTPGRASCLNAQFRQPDQTDPDSNKSSHESYLDALKVYE